MTLPSRQRIGYAGLATVGAAGTAIALWLGGVGAAYAVLFGAVALVGAGGLTGRERLRAGGFVAGAAVSLVAGLARVLQYGPERLGAVLLLLGVLFAVRSVQQYRHVRSAAA